MRNFEYLTNFDARIFKTLFSENEEKFSNKCLQIVSQFCSDLEVLSIGGSKVDINGLVLVGKMICVININHKHVCKANRNFLG